MRDVVTCKPWDSQGALATAFSVELLIKSRCIQIIFSQTGTTQAKRQECTRLPTQRHHFHKIPAIRPADSLRQILCLKRNDINSNTGYQLEFQSYHSIPVSTHIAAPCTLHKLATVLGAVTSDVNMRSLVQHERVLRLEKANKSKKLSVSVTCTPYGNGSQQR